MTSVSTLKTDLNSKIQEANERKKADGEHTKKELVYMEARMNKRLDDHDESFSLLHKAQMTLDQNMKVIMLKLGVSPVNDKPPPPPTRERDTTTDNMVDEEGDFTMTPVDFDSALADCASDREERLVQKLPPSKKGRGENDRALISPNIGRGGQRL